MGDKRISFKMSDNNQEKETDLILRSSKLKKFFLIALLLSFSLALLVGSGVVFLTWRFGQLTGLGGKEVLKSGWEGFRSPYNKEYLTILVLGLDQREDDNSLLTDTILLATINTGSGDYLLFSIPRDLWILDLKTKINALYYYGQKKDPGDGSQMVKEKLEELLAWPIDYVVLFKMEQIKELVDRVGGVEVEVARAFIDERFPKDDDSGEVMVVSFKEGKQTLSGERALQFMRSRQSEDPVEGTDEARQKRQKQVILALQNKFLAQKSLWLDLGLMANLFDFTTREIKSNPQLDLPALASFWPVGKSVVLGGRALELELDWQNPDSVLAAEREPQTNSWILIPKNNDWRLIEDYFKKALP